MKTHGWVAIALAAVLLAVSVPASADFHGDCTGIATAYANTNLTAEENEAGDVVLRYSGIVNCPGADVDIENLEVAPVGGDVIESTQAGTCAATLTSPCEASETIPAPDEGDYRVSMTFSTTTFQDVAREQHWHWAGDGQPVPVCVHSGFSPFGHPDCA